MLFVRPLFLYCIFLFLLTPPDPEIVKLNRLTLDLLASLDVFSGHKLTRSDDLGMLVELATVYSLQPTLSELSFLAKFICKTHGLIGRIGVHGNGYDKLAREFSEALKKAITLITVLLAEAPQDTRQRFESLYMSLTSGSLDSLLALCYDLSWYKNWLIDHSGRDRS